MILLSGHSLTPSRKIPLESMQLTLKERDSSATIVPAETTGIQIGKWMQDETNPGKGIVWRVKSIRQAYNSDTTTVTLEHAITTLRDQILFGEVKPATMAGRTGATTCTAKQAVQYILKQQSDWTLGTFSFTDSNPYKFDGESLFDALVTVTDSLDGAVWGYDFSSYPFKLNIRKASDEVDSELRANRNLKTITKSIDKSGMFTRFYPIGKDDLRLDGKYVQKNTGTYGVISKVETDQSITTKAELTRWANERLAKHAEPTVTIEAEGFELSDATGEPMDKLLLNRVCRIPLPEFGTVIQERIVSLSYADKVKQPENVKVTLANNKNDITKILSEALKKSGKSSRTSTKKGAEDRAWFEDTNDHVSMCAKGIIGVDATGKPNWERLSKITADGTGIHQSVQSVQRGLTIAESKIEQTETSISQMVSAVGENGKITAASIVLAINNDKSNAKISADNIILDGEIALNKVLRVLSNTATFTGLVQFGTDSSTRIRIGNGYVSSPSLRVGAGTKTHMIDFNVLDGMIKNMQSRSGGVIRLTRFDGTYLDFSHAVTSWDFGWSSGTLTVTVQPGNSSTPDAQKRSLSQGSASRSGTTITIPIRALYGSSQQYSESTGWEASVNVANVFSSMNMTRAVTRISSQGSTSYYGRLYYWSELDNAYKAASSSDQYWYYSGTNRAGTTTAYY